MKNRPNQSWNFTDFVHKFTSKRLSIDVVRKCIFRCLPQNVTSVKSKSETVMEKSDKNIVKCVGTLF